MGLQVWVRGEAFDHGVFNASTRWTVTKVLDFVSLLRDASSGAKITKERWVRVSTQGKPGLTEQEALAYWHVFSGMLQSIIGNQGPAIDVRFLCILLMCQVFSPHRHRNAATLSTEMWPSSERSGGASSPRHSPRGQRGVALSPQTVVLRGKEASSALLAFVRQHLRPLLQVCCFATTDSAIVNVTPEELDLLGLILAGGRSFTQPARRLSEAVPEFLTTRTLSLEDALRAVSKNLAWNEVLYPAAEQGQPCPSIAEEGRALNICGMSKITWFPKPDDVSINFLNITSCTDCCFYVTSPVQYCLLAGCHDCTVIMCAVSGHCTVQNCEKTSVHVAANAFKMDNSIDCSAYLYCHSPPILAGDSRGVKLAPFNVVYSRMHTVLQDAGMSYRSDKVDGWAHPVCCTLGGPDETLGGRSGSLEEPSTSTYVFVHPKDFQTVCVPEAQRQHPSKPALCLPQVYDDALKQRAEEMRDLQKQLAQIEDAEGRQKAEQVIQGHFREWLQQTGKSRQLSDLARMSM
mmetsp:Transcript_6753/g.16473  ORF Transcript_6753/g.16473 Transcript_6753/m.16473 type:complete len:518 (-) Transcript_6753:27-1580(-)